MSVKALFEIDGQPTAVTVESGEHIHFYEGIAEVVDGNGDTVGVFHLANLIGVVVEPEPEQPEVVRSWQRREDIPDDVKVATSSNGCRWQRYDREVPDDSPDGTALTGWFWSSIHAETHGYKYGNEGPFTEGWSE